jgi:dipeptidase
MYTIREVDANDKANFILSPNLFEVAKSKGWSLGSAGVTMVVG